MGSRSFRRAITSKRPRTFQRAYVLNDKFGDAMLWEARCFDALGLAPLADSERRYVA